MGPTSGDVDTKNSNCIASVVQINVLCATYPGDFLAIIAVIVCGESRNLTMSVRDPLLPFAELSSGAKDGHQRKLV